MKRDIFNSTFWQLLPLKGWFLCKSAWISTDCLAKTTSLVILFFETSLEFITSLDASFTSSSTFSGRNAFFSWFWFLENINDQLLFCIKSVFSFLRLITCEFGVETKILFTFEFRALCFFSLFLILRNQLYIWI